MTVLVNETASGRSQTDAPTEVTDLDKTEANKSLTVSLIGNLLVVKYPSKITEYMCAESYAQHDMFKYTTIHQGPGDGNFVLTVGEGEWNGTTNAFYDLFRTEVGMIVEPRDVIQPVPTAGLANTNGMFAGFDAD